jgi:hypothetical protein
MIVCIEFSFGYLSPNVMIILSEFPRYLQLSPVGFYMVFFILKNNEKEQIDE